MKLKQALAALVFLGGTTLAAHADEYGCQVLLCMSNPSGAMAEKQCEPPIQRMLREQAEKPPKPFPQCEEANGKAGVSMGMNPYDSCPINTVALEKGAVVMLGLPPRTASSAMAWQQTNYSYLGANTVVSPNGSLTLYTGIGDGSNVIATTDKLVCVGKALGRVALVYPSSSGDSSDARIEYVQAFDRVVTLDATEGSPRYFDVQVNGMQSRRVRF